MPCWSFLLPAIEYPVQGFPGSHTSTSGALGSVSGLGAKLLQAAQCSQEINKDIPARTALIGKCSYISLNERRLLNINVFSLCAVQRVHVC